MTIEPLTQKTLLQAIQLAQNTFTHDDPEVIELILTASLNLKESAEKVQKLWGVSECFYWVALEGDQVIGLIGYYILPEDQEEAAWVGWFCVDPLYQKKKIGLTLLDMIIEKARVLKKSYLRLFTSDIPEEERAHQIYKKRGFVEFREPRYHEKSKTTHLYFQLTLDSD